MKQPKVLDLRVSLNNTIGKIYHAPELYVGNNYAETLNSNPFARSLVRTHQEGSSTRFPNGSLLTLIPSNYRIKPHVDEIDPTRVLSPSYILGNKRFIQTVVVKDMWQRYLSLKFKNKTGESRRYKVDGGISLEFKETLESRIKEGLKMAANDKEGDGLVLKPQGTLFEIIDGIPYLCIPGIHIDKEQFISYVGNETLCYDILRLMRYYL